MTEPICVTGMGACTPGGLNVQDTWDRVVSGHSVARRIDRFPLFSDDGPQACAVVPGYEGPISQTDSHALLYGQMAIEEALAQANSSGSEVRPQFLSVGTHGERRLPLAGRSTQIASTSEVAAALAERSGGMGWSGVYGACAAGVLAIYAAVQLIRSGAVDCVIAGGTDCLLREPDFFAFSSLLAMSSREVAPSAACAPFDLARDGFVLGEGAGFVVLESQRSVEARAGTVLGLVNGVGSAQNAYHIVASPPDAVGPTNAIRWALADAGVEPDGVDYICAHGTSTRDNDWCETLAIRRVFGEWADAIPVSSTKGVLGHTMGAAGAIETILSLKAIETNTVPPTAGLVEQDPKCDLDCVPGAARSMPVQTVVNNSFGFGGHSSSLVLSGC